MHQGRGKNLQKEFVPTSFTNYYAFKVDKFSDQCSWSQQRRPTVTSNRLGAVANSVSFTGNVTVKRKHTFRLCDKSLTCEIVKRM